MFTESPRAVHEIGYLPIVKINKICLYIKSRNHPPQNGSARGRSLIISFLITLKKSFGDK